MDFGSIDAEKQSEPNISESEGSRNIYQDTSRNDYVGIVLILLAALFCMPGAALARYFYQQVMSLKFIALK